MLEFIKTRDVKDPERNEVENAGVDVFVPEKDSYTEKELESFGDNVTINSDSIIIAPHSDVKIPAGIKSKFPQNIGLIANNKSGIATKSKLIFGASVIDSSYQGEWHLHLINWSDEERVIKFGQKIVQFIPHLISLDKVVVRDQTEEEFFTESTERGAGGFGHTGV